MSKLLDIQASPRVERSHSRAVADAFVEACRETRPDEQVETLDLFRMDMPAFDGLTIRAKYAILNGKEHSDEERVAWKDVETVIAQFKSADKYALAVPMWNFGVPYRLKQYFDVIVQPGYTFSFSPETGYQGMVTDRPVAVVYARGGEFAEGTDGAAFDQQKPYVDAILRFMGFTDIHTLVVEPTLMGGPEAAVAKQNAAMAQAVELAKNF